MEVKMKNILVDVVLFTSMILMMMVVHLSGRKPAHR